MQADAITGQMHTGDADAHRSLADGRVSWLYPSDKTDSSDYELLCSVCLFSTL